MERLCLDNIKLVKNIYRNSYDLLRYTSEKYPIYCFGLYKGFEVANYKNFKNNFKHLFKDLPNYYIKYAYDVIKNDLKIRRAYELD